MEAEFIIEERVGALQVSASALFRDEEQWSAFRILNGRAVLTPVELGIRNGLSAHVVNGLSEGDEVIIYPGDSVADGVRVRPRH